MNRCCGLLTLPAALVPRVRPARGHGASADRAGQPSAVPQGYERERT